MKYWLICFILFIGCGEHPSLEKHFQHEYERDYSPGVTAGAYKVYSYEPMKTALVDWLKAHPDECIIGIINHAEYSISIITTSSKN